MVMARVLSRNENMFPLLSGHTSHATSLQANSLVYTEVLQSNAIAALLLIPIFTTKPVRSIRQLFSSVSNHPIAGRERAQLDEDRRKEGAAVQ